ncbi:MAG: low temperature requirement protein A [Acidimicrobiia bacterium]
MSDRSRTRLRMEATLEGARVTPVELFFDLVFVFALTQVTALMADDLSTRGLIRGMLILGLLWWSWTAYAWLANVVRADKGAGTLALLAAMCVMFVLALATPEAFDDLPGGLAGPVVVALCYFALRVVHLVLFWIIAKGDSGLRRQLLRFAPSMIGGTAFLLAASQFTGPTQTMLWALALLADYGGTYLGGAQGWRLHSAAHFAERHALILIIALGESIVAIGVGVVELPISWPIVGASVVGLMLSAAMWWAYFDVSAPQGEHALAAEPEATRPRFARDAYSFLHFPMLAGVVLSALGLKKVLEYVGDTGHHQLTDPLGGVGLYALYSGVALYLLGHLGFKWRTVHHLNVDRAVAAGLLLALIPVAAMIPALAALALVTAVGITVISFETIHFAEHRDQVRHRASGA